MKAWKVGPRVKGEEIVEIILKQRGLKNEQEREEFLKPKRPENLSLKEVRVNEGEWKKAKKRIEAAIDKKETMVVYGDYDADGICATAIMWEALQGLGAKVWPFIPHREEHGYGLSSKGIEAMLEERQPKLVITVDNGIVANKAAKELKEKKIDLIITDHHQVGKQEPEALAILHTTQLCGSGVAWMIAKELNSRAANGSLDLAGVGTVADMMPVLEGNRSLVKYGLERLRITDRVGLVELYQEAMVDPKAIDTYTINFLVAPRLNATGRLAHGLDSLRLLCTHDPKRAKELAQALGRANRERQDLLGEQLEHAKRSLGEGWRGQKILIVEDEIYHQGVIGLIAGKLTEEFYRPSIVLSVQETFAKASARSIPGFDIIGAIRQVEDLVVEAGGHPMAAGFSVERGKIEALTERLRQVAEKELSEDKLRPVLKIDGVVKPEDISRELYEALQKLAPFGIGNPRPTLAMEGVTMAEARLVGKGKHLKLRFKETQAIEAIGFNLGKLLPQVTPGRKVDVAFQVDKNVWNSREKVELRVKDVRLSV